MKTFLILHDIRSSENVGAIFRTADASGVSKIYLTGYTPAPLDRFKRKNTRLAKAALGAEDTVVWESRKDVVDVVRTLREEGVAIVSVEQTNGSKNYTSWKPKGSRAFIFGNEVTGLPEDIIARSDVAVEIPMYGKKESLNVSVSVGIILFSTRS